MAAGPVPAGGTLQRGPGRRGRVRGGGGGVPPALPPHVTRDTWPSLGVSTALTRDTCPNPVQ